MWDEEGGMNGGEFAALKYMFYGEGTIETTMRAGEGHQMREENNVSKAGMSCRKPGESNCQGSGGLV